MSAINSVDNNGKITLFEFVLDSSESEFKLIGLNSFFDSEDDKNINWKDYFGLR